jgi:hypothetical protein
MPNEAPGTPSANLDLNPNAGTNAPDRAERLREELVHRQAEEATAREQVEVWIDAVRQAFRDGGPLPPAGARARWREAVDRLDAALGELERLTP